MNMNAMSQLIAFIVTTALKKQLQHSIYHFF